MITEPVLMFEDSHVKDFDSWKEFFDDGKIFREKHGFIKEYIFQDIEDPNHISLVFEVESVENAIKWMESDLLSEILVRSGVIGKPKYTFRH